MQDMNMHTRDEGMKVAIEFFGIQQSYTHTRGIELPLNGYTTVNDIVDYVKNNYPGLPMDDGVHIIVNQKIASPETVLAANDTVAFLPTIHGG